ncbi:1-acyl-sn-glycerol-3-phosphate acyltransferase [Chitinimonas sp. BJYL2]|uniref:1-acyl-sn-glycerol-3-phosphate acyltransferase n=1 Tax=Chitinimonas sp. BJYL2 TaxID=2976696 RepID=UPI0022B3EDDE|nr:1-acyl-sn-glycerol-3-phosphate acyltransferase [Chitinimonas sp. BJYL2]
MISIEHLLNERFPAFACKPAAVRKPVVLGLQALLREKRLNELMRYSEGHTGLAFNDRLIDFLDVRYTATGIEHIPATGPLVVVANHPLGALDGAALIQMISRIRRDVRMVVSDVLLQFKPARDILLPVDNLGGRNNRRNVDGIDAALARGEAVIIFPSGEVSRASPRGIRDGIWRTGFLRVAARAQASILPIHIGGRNSLGFYAWSMLYKPAAMLLLAKEAFGNRSIHLPLTIGKPVSWAEVEAMGMELPAAATYFQQHVYRLGQRPRATRFGRPLRAQ